METSTGPKFGQNPMRRKRPLKVAAQGTSSRSRCRAKRGLCPVCFARGASAATQVAEPNWTHRHVGSPWDPGASVQPPAPTRPKVGPSVVLGSGSQLRWLPFSRSSR